MPRCIGYLLHVHTTHLCHRQAFTPAQTHRPSLRFRWWTGPGQTARRADRGQIDCGRREQGVTADARLFESQSEAATADSLAECTRSCAYVPPLVIQQKRMLILTGMSCCLGTSLIDKLVFGDCVKQKITCFANFRRVFSRRIRAS